MSEFLLLFRGGNNPTTPPSPEQMQAHMQRWMVWMRELTEKGIMLGGHPLQKGGKTLTGSKMVITDGPFIEGKEVVGGYILIKATDENNAVEISKDCPIFEYDGVVEIRQIEQRQM